LFIITYKFRAAIFFSEADQRDYKDMITERQWFQEGDFLRRLFDAIPSLLFVVDADVRIFHLNSAATSVLGDQDSVLMKRGGEVLHCINSYEVPEGCGRAPSCRDCVIRNAVGKAFRGEEVYRETAKMALNENGIVAEAYFMITVNSLDYRGEKFVLLVLEDVTRLKEYEDELRQRSFQLEAANRELEAFSYSVSHDLKAPLRRISGFLNILSEEHAGGLDDQGRDYLGRVISASDEMSRLIEALLDLSRMTRGGMLRQEVGLSALADEVGSELRSAHTDHVPEFAVAPGLFAMGDRQLLRIALENLIGNAFKFSSGRNGARVEFGLTEKDGIQIYYVRDNGAGFDMTYGDRLFAPFQRLHSVEEFPGTGIGLATVQRIIHRHGGRIWAEGAIDKGATFYFTLG
jgi:signal transduction histidine kinase